jgi:hypothetical protein
VTTPVVFVTRIHFIRVKGIVLKTSRPAHGVLEHHHPLMLSILQGKRVFFWTYCYISKWKHASSSPICIHVSPRTLDPRGDAIVNYIEQLNKSQAIEIFSFFSLT